MLNTTSALFIKAIVRVVKTMLANSWEILFKMGDPNEQCESAKRLKYFTEHQFEQKNW